MSETAGVLDVATLYEIVEVAPGASVPMFHVTVPAAWLHEAPPVHVTYVVFAGTASVAVTLVALPAPLFSTTIV